MTDFEKVLQIAVERLERLGIPFHITGGVAVATYGDPRFTQDIDFVIALEKGSPKVEEFIQGFESDFYLNADSIKQAVALQRLFQALHKELVIKIDFHLGEAVPDELSRSVHRNISSNIFAPVVSLPDAILSKLIWVRKGSHKSRRDIRSMIRLNSSLNIDDIYRAAEKLGLKELLEETLSEREPEGE